MGTVITFYSYKGGTGRSMALANVAHILAWQLAPLRKVLMIDWDLEAPGLHKYFYDQLKGNFTAAAARDYSAALNEAPGLIDLLQAAWEFYRQKHPDTPLSVMYAETEAARSAFNHLLGAIPLANFTLSVSADPDSSPDVKARGLYLMKAGNQASGRYVSLIRTFPWQEFYESYGSFFTLLQEYLTTEYEVVLIDSRTGLTDIGDICTRVMPEKLVGVFVPNEQNIEGLIEVLQGAARFRRKSRDPRGLLVFPLASRIDAQRSQLRQVWWKGGTLNGRTVIGYEPRFEKLVRELYGLEVCDLDAFFDGTQLPHDADFAFGEDVAARSPQSGHLTIGYACTNLARYLMSDCAPWENLTDPSPTSSITVSGVGSHERVIRRPAALVGPLALAVFGLLIALLGSAVENRIFRTNLQQGDVISHLGNVTVTLSSRDIAGFGIGTAEIQASVSDVYKAQFAVVQLDSSPGSVAPDILLVTATGLRSSPMAVLRSAGLGMASVRLVSFETARGADSEQSSSPPPVPEPPTGNSETIAIRYHWPIGMTAAALGGALIGLAYRLYSSLKGPFRRPSLPTLLVLGGTDLLVAIIAVVMYLFALAPLLGESIRFNVGLVMLLAGGAPQVIQDLVLTIGQVKTAQNAR